MGVLQKILGKLINNINAISTTLPPTRPCPTGPEPPSAGGSLVPPLPGEPPNCELSPLITSLSARPSSAPPAVVSPPPQVRFLFKKMTHLGRDKTQNFNGEDKTALSLFKHLLLHVEFRSDKDSLNWTA